MADNFRTLYNINGGGVAWTQSYGIASSEAWDVGAVLALNSDGALAEAADDSSDVWGLSLESVTSGAALGPVTDRCAVHPFQYGVVYACFNVSNLSDAPVATDIGTLADLDLSSSNWGILVDTAGTSNTPQFRVVDIDTIRNEWHVVIAPLELTDVFQTIDAAV